MQKNFAKLLRWFVEEVSRIWLWPTISTLVLTVLSKLVGLPWGWMPVAGALAFEGITTGLLRFDEWRYRTKVEGKLIISNVYYSVRNFNSESVCMCLGFVFRNEATFPIVFNDISVETKIAGSCPKQDEYVKKPT